MDDVRKEVWRVKLLVDINSRYYGCIAAKYYQRDLWSKIFLALFSSSGAIAGWAIWRSTEFPWLTYTWNCLTSIAAVLAVTLPFLNYAKKLECATRLKTEFADLHQDYTLLWLEVDARKPAELKKELQKLWEKEKKLSTLESHFPKVDQPLFDKCQEEVTRCLG